MKTNTKRIYRLGKKGQISHTMLKSFMWFFLLAIVLLSIVFLVKGLINLKIDTKEIEANLFFEEIFFAQNGISYYDNDIERGYPGIIDINKFNINNFKNSISYGEKNYYLAAKINLKSDDLGIDTEFIYNEEWYNRWEPLANSFTIGPGSAQKITKQRYILIKDGDQIKGGILKMNIIFPSK